MGSYSYVVTRSRPYLARVWNLASSSAVRARSKTATPPIQPVKPTLRELWMTRPMVKGAKWKPSAV